MINTPFLLTDAMEVAAPVRAMAVDGLPGAIDTVASSAPATHRFLTRGWFGAAVSAYGGEPRTVVVEQDGVPVLALPFVGLGPRRMRLAAVPGSYWPFRSVPMRSGGGAGVAGAALDALAAEVNGVRLGPVYDGDPAGTALIEAARASGWAVIDRYVAQSWLLDMGALRAEGAWPRGSTLRKNRNRERHLEAQGEVDWRFLHDTDWPAALTRLGEVEALSWVKTRTGGRDAKFLPDGHLRFWQAAAADPALRGMMRGALMTLDCRPAASSVDLATGGLKYAIANSYDPAVAKHSPGNLLHYRNLVNALDRDITHVDWGAGDSGYKQDIGAIPGPLLRDWLLLRPGLPATIGRLARGLWRRSGNTPPDATG